MRGTAPAENYAAAGILEEMSTVSLRSHVGTRTSRCVALPWHTRHKRNGRSMVHASDAGDSSERRHLPTQHTHIIRPPVPPSTYTHAPSIALEHERLALCSQGLRQRRRGVCWARVLGFGTRLGACPGTPAVWVVLGLPGCAACACMGGGAARPWHRGFVGPWLLARPGSRLGGPGPCLGGAWWCGRRLVASGLCLESTWISPGLLHPCLSHLSRAHIAQCD